MTTTNLADFGQRERELLINLLTAWNNEGLPNDFDNTGVVPMMNQSSGNVFLTNGNFQVCMMNGENIESFYSSPYEGKEGFFTDLLAEYPEMYSDDQEWFRGIAENIGRESELPEL